MNQKRGQNPKRIPYGIANYEQIVYDNYFFVDKTEYIRTLENYSSPVFLRPRRFGKTLLCSILECYYDVKRKEKFATLFGHTAIGKNPTGEQNNYLVMRFNFSTVSVGENMPLLEKNFDFNINLVYQLFLTNYQEYFQKFTLETGPSSAQLQSILSFISENNLPQLYLIIDEYDNFSNQLVLAQDEGLYEELTSKDSFFKTFFKVIKAGTESGAIGRVFITGVLPITIDDLTSGYNIAEIVTLKEPLHSMLGFTQEELEIYLAEIYQSRRFNSANLSTVLSVLKNYYNGYRFLPNCESLYNSTIINFFLKDFIESEGKIPREFIDTNLRTDLNWIRRLTRYEADTKAMLDQLMFNDRIRYDIAKLSSKFNARQFFDAQYYPVSLFYLGMISITDDFAMVFPNQTMKEIFADYYNEINKIVVTDSYIGAFEKFSKDRELSKLFSVYWNHDMGQISSQAADKV
ncbi:MAG TPA: hypothetical protein ENN84_03835, partial [Candidatus Marinimicrobia bacterium]|nr:hypothetical protein [Candidatus Neomarinimicrobiota bacterium]